MRRRYIQFVFRVSCWRCSCKSCCRDINIGMRTIETPPTKDQVTHVVGIFVEKKNDKVTLDSSMCTNVIYSSNNAGFELGRRRLRFSSIFGLMISSWEANSGYAQGAEGIRDSRHPSSWCRILVMSNIVSLYCPASLWSCCRSSPLSPSTSSTTACIEGVVGIDRSTPESPR